MATTGLFDDRTRWPDRAGISIRADKQSLSRLSGG